MWLYSIVTYAHFISVFILFSALIVELSIIKEEMTENNFIILKKANVLIGIFSGLTIATGLLRMYYFGKGPNYYLSNPLFIVKLSLFAITGLLSIYPTIQFNKSKNLETKITKLEHFKAVQLILKVELVLFLVIPLLAVFVAKGIV
ncbi:DUF2214 family protein [uncultured Maribacter sp.]|uniref:DUF2214 family protein n=1 Tax=uncultured Maribacter sp. TaxID=431308 RepID=UPI00260CD015|nr:DUF2214 family protein [uncultured Maribacter sp.]